MGEHRIYHIYMCEGGLAMVREIRDIIADTYNPAYNSFDINIQDQVSIPISIYLINTTEALTPSLTEASSVGDTEVTVDDASSVVGDGTQAINIVTDARHYQGIITGVTDTVLTVVPPLDIDVDTSSQVQIGSWNLATADGSVTHKVFSVSVPTDVQ